MCFGGRKTHEERKICLKICLFSFPEMFVMGSATTAACKGVLFWTLIGPFWIWASVQILNGPIRVEGETTLRATVVADPVTRISAGEAKEANFKAKFSFFTSLSTAEAQGFGVKFIGLYRNVGFIAIRDFSLWGESDLWSDIWTAMDGVVCLSILLEGGVTVSNNFTKRRQNGF